MNDEKSIEKNIEWYDEMYQLKSSIIYNRRPELLKYLEKEFIRITMVVEKYLNDSF